MTLCTTVGMTSKNNPTVLDVIALFWLTSGNRVKTTSKQVACKCTFCKFCGVALPLSLPVPRLKASPGGLPFSCWGYLSFCRTVSLAFSPHLFCFN